MKILSLKIKNYRVHRDCFIEFSGDVPTLIGGPNESGKSTLVEALHNGLFLPSKTGGDLVDRMSPVQGGDPEIEVRFETGDARWHLLKKFIKWKNTTLKQEGGASFNGDEAEEKLAQILGVEKLERGNEKKLHSQWENLWVWQGQSGDDPSDKIATQQALLLEQLQRIGGAVVMQSTTDSAIMKAFTERNAQNFTDSGKPKAGSALVETKTAEGAAKKNLDAANEREHTLQDASDGYERATAAIATKRDAIEKIERERGENSARMADAAALRVREKEQSTTVTTATATLDDLREKDAEIHKLAGRVQTLRRELAPARVEVSRLSEQFEVEQKAVHDAEVADAEARKQTATQRDAKERADLGAAFFAKQRNAADRAKEADTLKKKVDVLEKLRVEATRIREKIARLPALETDKLSRLRTLSANAQSAEAAVAAMSAEIEVLEASEPLGIAGKSLPVGERVLLSDIAEITSGKSLRLRIRPGGGDRLVESRQAALTAAVKLKSELDALGVASPADAEEKAREREGLQRELDGNAAKCEGIDSDGSLISALEEANAARASVESALALLRERLAGSIPASSTGAEEQQSQAGQALLIAEAHERESLTRHDSAKRKRDKTLKDFEKTQKTNERAEHELRESEMRLKVLLEQNGGDDARAAKLAIAKTAADSANAALAATRAELSRLQPDVLEATANRLNRAREQHEQALRDAERAKIENETLLRRDGFDDPRTELERAKKLHADALENLRLTERLALSIRRISELFDEEQRNLSKEFSRPLAERVTAYLRRLFTDVKVGVVFDSNGLGGIEIVRGTGTAFAFATLSGGMREQVAAAVRLAIAELLAKSHDGSLPVVFDDAFAFSDPERVNSLQGMLDLAASHGLQVIILTCNPADYATLGIKTVSLPSPAYNS